MILLLNPLHEGLKTARRAAADVTHPDDEVTWTTRADHLALALVFPSPKKAFEF